MIRNDYIMRLISVFMERLVDILNQRMKGESIKALGTINQTTERIVGIDMTLLKGAPPVQLLDFMKVDDVVHPDKCVMIGELMKHEAEIEQETSKLAAVPPLFNKALFLLIEGYLRQEEKTDDLRKRIDDLLGWIPIEQTEPEIGLSIHRYYEFQGLYSKAEDALFHVAEVDPESALETGTAFYNRLLKKSDSELQEGNLPRKEVKEGLQDLKSQQRG